MKEKVLEIIKGKITELAMKNKFIVDTTSIVALKEVYNEILEL